MNPGYLSLLLLVISLILFASGWKDFILRGITHPSLLLFFVCWLLATPLSVTIGSYRVFLCVPLLLCCCLRIWYQVRAWMVRLHALSVSLLLGSVTFFLRETLHLLPSMIIVNQQVTMALFIGILAAGLIRNPIVQVANVSMGLLIGETMFHYSHLQQAPFVLGGTSFQDLWWTTVFAARGSSLVLSGFLFGIRRSAEGIWELVKQRRD
ncbi:hypothetical protein RAC89_02840 [Paenibacillus sp. GD4]|jgi:hypothetical protein|uniref:hypothetical protein n=1 Tax=Paenibacillus sp. GD4 TaxID=3068890 RepID=UPI002796C51C|nr:hypothetical protein [Paenibacillus sp. GD4]MDQ1909437.1 hypothetical protein [Paenibacillus sp. GD4]